MGACRAACGNAISSSCGWIPKHHRFMLCQQKLLRQCKRWGVDGMCPAPAQPTPTTTLPPPPPPTTTTTTLRYIPPTTTTLPPPLPPQVAHWAGVWDFSGTLSSDTCGTNITTLVDTFTISQSGVNLSVTVADVPGLVMTGQVAPDGHFTVSGGGYDQAYPGCAYGVALEALPNGTIIVTTESAGVALSVGCGNASCSALYVGAIVRVS